MTDGKAMPFPNRIPLVIGVTGHRDLLDADIGRLKEAVTHYPPPRHIEFCNDPA